jgi:TRAP transporter TAXI family solute receptor
MLSRTILGLVVVLVILGLAGLWSSQLWNHYTITLAAGPSTGESYHLAKALQKVAKRQKPHLSIVVLETRDSLQNMHLLAEGRVNFATAQADLSPNGSARLICELYSDMFQLIANEDSGIKAIDDLVGKRIGLPPKDSSGYRDFMLLAAHYGLGKDQISILTGTDHTLDWLFLNGDIDALFRVRAPGASSILKLIGAGNGQLVPIQQAAALRLRQPALQRAYIPEGSYQGRPAVPATNTPTVALRQLLLARSDVPDDVVFEITSILFENRRELVELEPLAGSISAPERSSGTVLPLHPGALQFFDRNRAPFLHRNAPAIALAVSLSILYLSASLQFGAWRRRRVMSDFNSGLLQLAQSARASDSYVALDQCRAELPEFVEKIIAAGEAGRISTSDMSLFNKAYEAVEEAIEHRRAQLHGSRFRFGSIPDLQSAESDEAERKTS